MRHYIQMLETRFYLIVLLIWPCRRLFTQFAILNDLIAFTSPQLRILATHTFLIALLLSKWINCNIVCDWNGI